MLIHSVQANEGRVPRRPQNVGRPAWLPFEEYPFRSRFVDVAGNRVHYVDEGQGPLLLLVHAGSAWSFVFREVIRDLRERFRCVALDFPGGGLSTAAPEYAHTLAAAALVLQGFIERLDLSAITMLVHDLGGPVGFAASHALPARVRALIITDSFGWPLRAHPAVARMLRVIGSPAFGFFNTNFNLLACLLTTPMGGGRHLSTAGKAAYRGPVRDRTVRRNVTALLRDAGRDDGYLSTVEAALRTRLNRLPALLIYGEQDPIRRAGAQARFQQIFPHAGSVVIAGAHHFPHLEAPCEVAAAIRGWWDAVAGPGASFPAGTTARGADR